MGKKLIIPNADFSENAIVIPMTITVKAGESITLNGVTYTADENEDTVFEFSSIVTPNILIAAQAHNKVTELNYGVAGTIGNINLQDFIYLDNVYFRKPISGVTVFYFKNTLISQIDFSNVDMSGLSGNFASWFTNCSNLTKIIFPDNMLLTNVSSGISTSFKNTPNLRTVIAPSLVSTDRGTEGTDTYKIAGCLQVSSPSTSIDLVCSDATIHWDGSNWS